VPAAARAQQPVIGFLSSRSTFDSAAQVAAFRAILGEAGYVERQNVAGALYDEEIRPTGVRSLEIRSKKDAARL